MVEFVLNRTFCLALRTNIHLAHVVTPTVCVKVPSPLALQSKLGLLSSKTTYVLSVSGSKRAL
jgi:hypothetical protein